MESKRKYFQIKVGFINETAYFCTLNKAVLNEPVQKNETMAFLLKNVRKEMNENTK